MSSEHRAIPARTSSFPSDQNRQNPVGQQSSKAWQGWEKVGLSYRYPKSAAYSLQGVCLVSCTSFSLKVP